MSASFAPNGRLIPDEGAIVADASGLVTFEVAEPL
jgi:hypothetical protein